MNSGQRMLVFIGAVFLAPLAIAFWMYYASTGTAVAVRSGARVNHGELIQPARPLPKVALTFADGGAAPPELLTRRWTLLFASSGECDEACKSALYDMRQVRLALDHEMGRVQRVWLASGACCPAEFLRQEHPGLIIIKADERAAPLASALSIEGFRAAQMGRIDIIDPLGNFIMSYPRGAPAKGILEDMKRLLRLSHIG